MPSFKFNLNNKLSKSGEDLVMIHISFKDLGGKYKKIGLSTNVKVLPENWLQSKQMVSKSDYLHTSKNQDLKEIQIRVENVLIDAKRQQIEGNTDFKTWFLEQYNGKAEHVDWQKRPIWKDWDLYLASNKNNWTQGTYKGKKVEYNSFKKFELHINQPITWGAINMQFYYRYIEFCFENCGFKNSNVGRLIKGLKSFMEWAFNNDLHQNLVYKKKEFSKPEIIRNIICFNPDELIRFYNLKLTSKSDNIIRDCLCFSCFTGLRHSDIKLLTTANFDGKWLNIVSQKVSLRISIPLNDEAIAILKKYEGLPAGILLPIPSDQKCNKGLHRILKNNNFDRQIEIVDLIRREKIRAIRPLHEVFTFHCGKKTFITLFKKFGGDTNVAMSITGNKDENVIRSTYESIDDELKEQQMGKVWATWRERYS